MTALKSSVPPSCLFLPHPVRVFIYVCLHVLVSLYTSCPTTLGCDPQRSRRSSLSWAETPSLTCGRSSNVMRSLVTFYRCSLTPTLETTLHTHTHKHCLRFCRPYICLNSLNRNQFHLNIFFFITVTDHIGLFLCACGCACVCVRV